MTMDKSLVSRGRLARHRNVLSRAERIALLEEEEKWNEEKSVFGLPKVRNIKVKQRKAAKAEAVEAAVPAEGAAAVPAEGVAAEAGKAAPGAKAAPAAKGGEKAAAPKAAEKAAKPEKGGKADKK